MDFLSPATWADALAAKAEHPAAVPIAGGTDVMVELNFDRRRPPALLDLTRIGELAEHGADNGLIRIGAGVPYTRIITELGDRLPGLAQAGDAPPPLLAAGAAVELASVRGTRRVPVGEFFTGPKRSVLAPDELIAAVLLEPAPGPQQFAKVGTRNAMVIAVCSVSVALDPRTRTVGTGIGSAAPTPVRAPKAEALAAELPWDGRGELPTELAGRFGALVAAAASPIDDVRGTAAYRRHALAVLGRRALTWAWQEYREGAA
jgi:CO/xanthine dehydrogenase FAD-binding subunit